MSVLKPQFASMRVPIPVRSSTPVVATAIHKTPERIVESISPSPRAGPAPLPSLKSSNNDVSFNLGEDHGKSISHRDPTEDRKMRLTEVEPVSTLK